MKLSSLSPRTWQKRGIVLALAACFWLPLTAHTASQTAPQSAPAAPENAEVREVQVAENRFSRGSALPAWVKTVAMPASANRQPLVIRLHDTQFYAGDTPAVFVDRAMQVHDAAALAAIGQIQLPFVPDYQRLNLHALTLIRDGQPLDRTASVNVRFLQREGRLEAGIYSGTVTAALLIDDVRVGDTLQIQYSIEGQNPVFANRFADLSGWDQLDPVELRRVSLLHPVKRPIHWRFLGDHRNTALNPVISEDKGWRRLQFEEAGIESLDLEPFIAGDYLPVRLLQFSEFADWADVNRWAASLPAELQKLVAQLKTLPSREAQVVAALQWTQEQIRYFSVSLGESSHRPYPPEQVLARRYGDCKDKTYLLVSLLRALDIEAWPVLTATRSRHALQKILPSPEDFDHAIVKVRVNGQAYFLDATRPRQEGRLERLGPYIEDADVLVVGPDTRGLEQVKHPLIRDLVTNTLKEDFIVQELGGKGSLSVEQHWRGNGADRMRTLISQQTPDQRRKLAMGSYERRYPGITLDGEPGFQDDPANNQFTFRARFAIPKLAPEIERSYVMRFFPGNLNGVFNIPDKVKRAFPLENPSVPYEARYEQTIEWPAAVSMVEDPSAQRINSDYFDATVTRSFRGHHAQLKVSFSSRADSVAPDAVQKLADDVTALNKAIGGYVAVDRNAVKSGGFLGLGKLPSVQETLQKRLNQQLDKVNRVIAGSTLKGEDKVEALCSRAETLADLGRPEEGLADAEAAIKEGPDTSRAWHCRGNLHYATGRFAKAIADYTKALTLGHDEFSCYYHRALARYYLNKLDDAAADFNKAASAAQEAGDSQYADLWLTWTLARLNRPLPQRIRDAGQTAADAPWPGPALALLTGHLNPDDLLTWVKRKEGDERELNLAEAWFYIGQHHLLNKNQEAAQTAFRNTRDLGITVYVEHVAAGFELERMKR